MSEEEIIKVLNYQINMKGTDVYTPINYDAIKGLLDLYNKQKEEIERLKNAEEYAKLGKETLLDTIHKQQEELETEKQYAKIYEEIVKGYEKICIDKNKQIEELKQEIKDITCIPQDDIRYDEEGNELLEEK